jgi:hypothetical protein
LLDGFAAKKDVIRQLLVRPLGEEYSVEES